MALNLNFQRIPCSSLEKETALQRKAPVARSVNILDLTLLVLEVGNQSNNTTPHNSSLPLHPGIVSEVERSGLLAVHSLLRELDPNQERLGLTRVPTYTGDYRWLCGKHYREWEPRIPDKIEPGAKTE